MPPPSFPKHPDQKGRVWIGVSFLLAALLRIGSAAAFPTIHGGDASARLAHADTLVLGYQLPLPQVFVFFGKALHDDPLLTRLIFCLWGGVLASGVTALAALAVGSRAALFAGLLLSTDPLLIHYSVVPYQEPIAYGLLAWAFFCAASGRERTGAWLMAAACLCRYEAWLFLPAFVHISRSRFVAMAAAAPVLGWILWWQGLAPRGLYVLDIDLHSNRLSRLWYLLGKFLEYETGMVLALAALGVVFAAIARAKVVLGFTVFLGALAMVIVMFGHEYPPGSGFMSERLIHLPVLLCLVLASTALDRISGRSRVIFATCLAATLMLAVRNLRFESALLRAAAADPDLALAREVARAIEARRSPGECVTVTAPRVDEALLQAYVAKVGAAFGDVDRARARAASLADTSPDRDRIAAHLKAKTGTVRREAGCPLLVIVDAAETGESRGDLAQTTLVAEISAGPRRARILRILP